MWVTILKTDSEAASSTLFTTIIPLLNTQLMNMWPYIELPLSNFECGKIDLS
jgi:hypothetical protein